MTNCEIRLKAADILVHIHKGWIQKKLLTSQGMCLVTALCHAIQEGGHGVDTSLTSDYCRVMNELSDELGMQVVTYNDTPGRTKEEVVDLLRKCKDVPSEIHQ